MLTYTIDYRYLILINVSSAFSWVLTLISASIPAFSLIKIMYTRYILRTIFFIAYHFCSNFHSADTTTSCRDLHIKSLTTSDNKLCSTCSIIFSFTFNSKIISFTLYILDCYLHDFRSFQFYTRSKIIFVLAVRM